MSDGIREVNVELSTDDESEVEIVFGPHHGLRISERGDEVKFRLVSTHHGFEVEATGDELPTQLEECIDLIREERSELAVDTF